VNKLNEISKTSSILDSIPGRVYALDLKGFFTFWNKNSQKYFGYHPKEIIGKKNFKHLFDDKKLAQKILKTTNKKGHFEGEIALIKKDGSKKYNKFTIKKFYEGRKHIGYIGLNYDITDLKKMETELADSLEKYKSLFENANDIIYFLDDQGRFLDLNRRAEEALGLSKKSFIGKKFTKLIHPDSIEETKKKFKAGMMGKKIAPYIIKVRVKGGKVRILEIRPSSIIKKGEIIGRFGIARDITDLQKIQEKLSNSEEKYRGVFENASDIIFFVNKEGRFLDINKRAEEFLGKKREKIIGKKFTTIIHPSTMKVAFNSFSEGMKGHEVGPYIIKAFGKGKKVRTFEIRSSSLTQNGKIIGRFGVARDITDRIKSEKDIERIKLQQEAILSNIPDIAWLKDENSRFIAVNEPFAKTLELKPKDLIGKTDLDFYPTEHARMYRADDKEVMRTGKRKRVEEPYEDAKGNRIFLDTIKTPIFNEKHEIAGTTGIARDITDRKKAEHALQ